MTHSCRIQKPGRMYDSLANGSKNTLESKLFVVHRSSFHAFASRAVLARRKIRCCGAVSLAGSGRLEREKGRSSYEEKKTGNTLRSLMSSGMTTESSTWYQRSLKPIP